MRVVSDTLMQRFTLALAASLWLHPAVVPAQLSRPVQRGDRSIGGWAAASFYMQGGAHFAAIRERNLMITDLRSEWVLEDAGPFALATTMDLVPLVVVSRRAGPLRDCWTNQPSGRSQCQSAESAPTYGAGAHPLGIKLYLANGARARLFAGGSVGMLFFNREMPIVGSNRMNFAVEYGGGVEANALGRSAIVVGWKFQHMSNGYTSPLNPGLDVNMLYLGLLRRRH